MKKNQKGISMMMLIIIIFIIIVLVIGVTTFMVFRKDNNLQQGNNKQELQTNKKENVTIEVPEKMFYKINGNEQLYIDKNGKELNLKDVIIGDIQNADFSYGTGIVKETNQGNKAIVDYQGKVLVDYGIYTEINRADMNFIATTKDYNYILLDSNGNQINNTNYASISQRDEGIYMAIYGTKTQIITASGSIIYETEETLNYDDIQIWKDGRDFIAILIDNEKIYIIDKDSYEEMYSFKCQNVGIGLEYVTDIDKNIAYVFDKENNMLKLENCLTEEDYSWNNYKAVYTGSPIYSYLDQYGYIVYATKDNKIKVVYKDGTVIFEKTRGDIINIDSNIIFGKDYAFIANEENIEVYSKNQKIKTIENRKFPYNIISIESSIINKNIPLYYMNENNEITISLYNEQGEKVNNNEYTCKQNSKTILENEGKSVKPLTNGEFMDAGNYADIYLLYNNPEKDEYSNKYFLGLISTPKENTVVYDTIDAYYLIDRDGNKLLQIDNYEPFETKLYEEDGILIYRNVEDFYCVYDLNEKKDVLLSESKLDYTNEFKIIETSKAIYSLTEKKSYQKY